MWVDPLIWATHYQVGKTWRSGPAHNLILVHGKTMTEEEYQKHLKTLPDPMSDKFLEVIHNNTIKAGLEVVLDNDYWLGVQNLKFYKGEPDPKYARPIENHYTYFSKQPAYWLSQLDRKSIEDMVHIVSRKYPTFYFYINAEKDKSISRLHFHIIEWKTN